MPDIGALIREEKLREQINAAKAEEDAANQAALKQNMVTPGDVAQALKPAALPVLGQAAGTVAGMATGPAAPFAVPALESLGGMGGEFLNQKLGITPPSKGAIALQGILPVGARAASMVGKVLPSSTKGATFLNEIAPVEASSRIAKIKASQPQTAKDLFTQAEAQGKKIPTLQTQQAIQDEIKGRLVGGAGADLYKGTRGYLETLGGSLKRKQGALTPTQYQRELRDIGSMIAKAGTDVERGALTSVKRTLEQALESAPQGSTLAQARKASLKESVLGDLDDLVTKAIGDVQGKEAQKFSAANILNKIRKDEHLAKRFQKGLSKNEQNEIIGIFENLKKIPGLPSDLSNTNTLLGDVFRGGRAGIAATMLGASPGIASGVGVASTLTRPAMDAARVFSIAFKTDEGRKALLKEVTAQKGRPFREIMQKVATTISATEPAQQGQRELFGATEAIRPFPNQQ